MFHVLCDGDYSMIFDSLNARDMRRLAMVCKITNDKVQKSYGKFLVKKIKWIQKNWTVPKSNEPEEETEKFARSFFRLMTSYGFMCDICGEDFGVADDGSCLTCRGFGCNSCYNRFLSIDQSVCPCTNIRSRIKSKDSCKYWMFTGSKDQPNMFNTFGIHSCVGFLGYRFSSDLTLYECKRNLNGLLTFLKDFNFDEFHTIKNQVVYQKHLGRRAELLTTAERNLKETAKTETRIFGSAKYERYE